MSNTPSRLELAPLQSLSMGKDDCKDADVAHLRRSSLDSWGMGSVGSGDDTIPAVQQQQHEHQPPAMVQAKVARMVDNAVSFLTFG
jgi:hypothetical protein